MGLTQYPEVFYFAMTKRNLRLLVLLLASLTPPALLKGQDLKTEPSDDVLRAPPFRPVDFNKDIYYRNKLEFSLEAGALPINIPFVFDVFVGGNYSQKPLHYTLVPIFPSIRWHMGDVNGPWILRGNTDLTATLSVTAIPRGPEKIYGAFDLGVRRNFVPRNWRATPYFEVRLGAGFIDAKGPDGNFYAQGQDFTFTLWLGSGLRYNFNPKYSMSLGGSYMHVSNAYLSEPKYLDNGINVTGGMIGFNMRLGKPKGESVR
ncbi:MAG: acyloxyacyl hydrolase [Edaphobacter sp.]